MKTAMCFGTFDKLHPGHLSYLGQARKHGDCLLVVVGRDKNVFRVKGKPPREGEKTRLKNIKKIKFVDWAILGQLRNKYAVIKKYKPDVICLGYDQQVDLTELKKVFKGKIVKLKSYKEHIFKSSKL